MSYTVNSNHPNNPPNPPPTEPTGAVAKDSLAAESLREGGSFAADSAPAPAPLGVSGSNSTLNTTDTSGARAVHPAQDDDKSSGTRYPDSGRLGSDQGVTSADGGFVGDATGSKHRSGSDAPAGASDFGATTTNPAAGGPDPSKISSSSTSGSTAANNNTTTSASSQSNTNTSSTSTSSSGPTAGVRPHVDAAPNYAASVSGAITTPGQGQPHGANLTEGGDIPESKKTFTGDVGGDKDPGRQAVKDFEGINQGGSGGGTVGLGAGARGQDDRGGQYDALGSSERA